MGGSLLRSASVASLPPGSCNGSQKKKKKNNFMKRIFSKRVHKRKKEEKRQAWLEQSLKRRTSNVDAEENQATVNKKNRTSLAKDVQLHYFWGSWPLLHLYSVIVTAITFRSLWFLHGIHLVLVGHIASLSVTWGSFVWDSAEFREVCSLIMWAVNRAHDEIDLVVHGDGLRIWLAGASTLTWNKMGKDFFFQLLRDQYSSINQAIVEEHRDNLDRNTRLHKKMLQKGSALRHHIYDEVVNLQENLLHLGTDAQEFGKTLRHAVVEKGIEARFNARVVQEEVRDQVSRIVTPVENKVRGRISKIVPTKERKGKSS